MLLVYIVFHVASTIMIKVFFNSFDSLETLNTVNKIEILLAIIFYIFSLSLIFYIVAREPIMLVYPISIGCTLICTTLSGIFIFNESLTGTQFLALLLILFGLLMLVTKGKQENIE